MVYIEQDEINDIRVKSNIVDIIGSYISLTQKGQNFFCVCPFHDDHAPSMSVSPSKQIYKCFSCGASGNVFTFVSNYENVSFIEAVAIVANKTGILITTKIEKTVDTKNNEEFEIMELASKFYQNNLNTTVGKKAKNYLEERGITEDIIKEFDIGLSLDNREALTKLLLSKNYSKEKLFELGLSSNAEDIYDIFNKRIMFPIHDISGHTIAFTGRIYKTTEGSKYINSKETKIFKKGNILYNYHNAKDIAKREKSIVVVEGNMDAIRLSANGIKNVVALMGTSLTFEQINLLKKLRVQVILCLDNDEAGENAADNIGDALQKNGINVSVIKLSDAKDPDEYILKKGIEAFKTNLKNPIKYFDYHLNYLKQNKNLAKSDELAEYINIVLKSLNDSNDDILKELTINNLSSEYQIAKETLQNKLKSFENIEIKKKEKIVTTEKPKRKNRYEIATEKLLYFMMSDDKYIRLYKKSLGFLENKLYLNIANEILYYFKLNNEINVADFISFVADKEFINNKVMEIIRNSSDDEINVEIFNEYIELIKKEIYLNEIKEIKNELKTEMDENKKIELLTRLTEIKKEV